MWGNQLWFPFQLFQVLWFRCIYSRVLYWYIPTAKCETIKGTWGGSRGKDLSRAATSWSDLYGSSGYAAIPYRMKYELSGKVKLGLQLTKLKYLYKIRLNISSLEHVSTFIKCSIYEVVIKYFSNTTFHWLRF